MISINGKVISGKSVTMVNGRIINGGEIRKKKLQKFDERKSEKGKNIDKILIDTIADVNVSISNSSKIEAHLYGKAEIDWDINFDVQVVNRELRITLRPVVGFNGKLKLDITVPQRTFKVISAKSLSADITLNEGVSAEHLIAETVAGDLETSATANNVSISTVSGDVDLCINAINDISVDVSTVSGDVSATFNNIVHINLSASSVSGRVKNHHRSSNGYTADVDISTTSGDIIVS